MHSKKVGLFCSFLYCGFASWTLEYDFFKSFIVMSLSKKIQNNAISIRYSEPGIYPYWPIIFPRVTARCLDSTSLNLPHATRFIKWKPQYWQCTGFFSPAKKCNSWSWTRTHRACIIATLSYNSRLMNLQQGLFNDCLGVFSDHVE